MRLKILRIIIAVMFGLIASNLFYVQVIRGQYFYNLSRNNRIRVVAVEGRRGKIFDRNGVVLADNQRAFNVLVIPQETDDLDELFTFLARTLNSNKERFLRVYRQRTFGAFAPVLIAEDVPKEEAIVLEENRFRFPGLVIQESFTRVYPFREALAHVVGYVGKISRDKMESLKSYGYTTQNTVGYTGAEEFYDSYLKGEGGGAQVEINSRGQQVRLLSLKEPLSGEDITLTIDHRIQQMAMNALGGHQGAIVLMDMASGEILALSSSPAFDPNAFIRNNVSETKAIFSNSASPLLNRAMGAQYAPGSVFKIPVALGALEQKRINEHTTFECEGSYHLGDREFRCTHIHGPENLQQAIIHSCNIYFYHIGLMSGPDTITRYAKLLGLGQPTGIDLPYEVRGNIPSRPEFRLKRKRAWYQGDTLNFSIGQGDVLATPLQLALMMSTIAQNGRVVHPHVIKSIGTEAVFNYSSPKFIPISNQIDQILAKAMQATVEDPSGTANVLNIPGLSIAGKTGTAQTFGGKETHAWFAGFSVSPKAKLAFCVFLEHGGSSYNACLIAREFFLRMQQEQIL